MLKVDRLPQSFKEKWNKISQQMKIIKDAQGYRGLDAIGY